jgi:putative redox protein
MKTELIWSDKMLFHAQAGEHQVTIDAKPPIGSGQGMAPKELLLSALVSCTAMDVAALLKKHKQKLEHFRIAVEAPLSEGGHPKTFTRADLLFDVTGDIDETILLDSVQASQTQFCGVSAMLSRAFPIAYSVVLNGTVVGSGVAHFETEEHGE